MSTLHIVFTPSGAGSLRDALDALGRDDRVVCPFDCYAFGPINPPDGARRAKWVADELDYAGWDNVVRETEAFWREALAEGERKVAWFSRRSAAEYSGFLEWLWRFGDRSCALIDVGEVVVTTPARGAAPAETRRALSMGLLTARQIIASGLIDRAEVPAAATRAGYRETWRRLRSEDAALRVLGPDGLVSAPIEHFDPLILSRATDRWRRPARIVGDILADELSAALLQTGDLVLASRVRALIEAGSLEQRGDPLDVQRNEVRLAGPGT